MAKESRLGSGVRAVDRALDVLMAFSPKEPSILAVDLARRTGLSRPTLYRLLYTLERKGFVVAQGEPQRFSLGPSAGQLGNVWTSSLDLNQLAHGMLRQLRDATGETVALYVQRGENRLCVAELVSLQPLSFRRGVGYSDRLTSGASGRAILSFASPDIVNKLVNGHANTTAPATLRAELARIRRRGFATSQNEFITGAVAVAAPFFEGNGHVAGCITVFGPVTRLGSAKVDAYGKLLLDKTAELSRALGYLPERNP